MLNVFLPKMPQTGEMLNVLNVSFFDSIFPKHFTYLTFALFGGAPNTLNILNISLVLLVFDEKHLTLPLFREPIFTKQGKC